MLLQEHTFVDQWWALPIKHKSECSWHGTWHRRWESMGYRNEWVKSNIKQNMNISLCFLVTPLPGITRETLDLSSYCPWNCPGPQLQLAFLPLLSPAWLHRPLRLSTFLQALRPTLGPTATTQFHSCSATVTCRGVKAAEKGNLEGAGEAWHPSWDVTQSELDEPALCHGISCSAQEKTLSDLKKNVKVLGQSAS